jgi:UDP-glucose 4-epimerase
MVVTGGAGFIGATLCKALSVEPDVDQIVVVDDLSTGNRTNLDGLDVDLRTGSILDRELLTTPSKARKPSSI